MRLATSGTYFTDAELWVLARLLRFVLRLICARWTFDGDAAQMQPASAVLYAVDMSLED